MDDKILKEKLINYMDNKQDKYSFSFYKVKIDDNELYPYEYWLDVDDETTESGTKYVFNGHSFINLLNQFYQAEENNLGWSWKTLTWTPILKAD